MTRAIHQMLHLKLASAIQYNPAVALLPIYFVIDFASYFKPEKRLILIRRMVFWLAVISLAVLYIFRIAEGLS
jgi:hypothetical protein